MVHCTARPSAAGGGPREQTHPQAAKSRFRRIVGASVQVEKVFSEIAVFAWPPRSFAGVDCTSPILVVVLSSCQDPRTELLKYDEEAKKNGGEFLGSAYSASQPEGGGMHHRTLEEEEEDFKEEQRKLLDS